MPVTPRNVRAAWAGKQTESAGLNRALYPPEVGPDRIPYLPAVLALFGTGQGVAGGCLGVGYGDDGYPAL